MKNDNTYSIGVIGYGFVGKAVSLLMTNTNCQHKDVIYDIGNSDFNSEECLQKVMNSNFVFLCLPTPSNEDGNLDISLIEYYVKEHTRRCDNKNSTIVIKSTLPPGTCKELQKNTNFPIVYNPEFLTQRTNIADFNNPIDIVIGHPEEGNCVIFQNTRMSPSMALSRIYQEYHGDRDVKIIIKNNTICELIKIVRNSFYATKISFMNNVYELCEAMEQDYEDVREGVTSHGQHPWWSDMHTFVPGPDGKFGYGGACFPKDTKGLYNLAQKHNVQMEVLKASIDYNSKKRKGEN